MLLTCEDLCEADPGRIGVLQDLFADAGFEPRVVITLRGLASTIPSEWQQFLKHRITLDYATFLERVRDRKGPWARHFWTRQDAVAMCERWSAVVGADQVDVIVTPPRSREPEGLYRMFGAVVGFDPAAMTWPERDVNASWGMVEAEVYRRLNVALGDRLPRYEHAYQPAVRWPLIKGVLPRGASARIPLPPEHLPWVVETAEEQARWLRESGIRVHGEPARPGPRPRRGRAAARDRRGRGRRGRRRHAGQLRGPDPPAAAAYDRRGLSLSYGPVGNTLRPSPGFEAQAWGGFNLRLQHRVCCRVRRVVCRGPRRGCAS